MTQDHQDHLDLRTEAVQAFQESLHDLEVQLMVPDSPDQNVPGCDDDPIKSPLPLKTANRLPFHISASTSLCQKDFDLESLQEAAADIDQFIQDRHPRNHRLA